MAEDIFYNSYLARESFIHIVDGDSKTCEQLSVLFRLEGFHTAFSIDVAGFFPAIERRPPELAIINGELGEDDGVTVMKRARSLRPGLTAFILLDRPSVELAVTAMKAGAYDVIVKPIDTDHLLQSARDALRENVHVGTTSSGRRHIEVRGFAQLTPREREVLELITNGQSNKEAGRELGISPRTIEVHRARVMEKLGARNTADLLRIVLST